MQSVRTLIESAAPLSTPSMVYPSGTRSKKQSFMRAYIKSEVFFVETGGLEGDQVVNGHFSAEKDGEITHVLIEDALESGVWVVRDVVNDREDYSPQFVIFGIIVYFKMRVRNQRGTYQKLLGYRGCVFLLYGGHH
jgi:hypothetical protein